MIVGGVVVTMMMMMIPKMYLSTVMMAMGFDV